MAFYSASPLKKSLKPITNVLFFIIICQLPKAHKVLQDLSVCARVCPSSPFYLARYLISSFFSGCSSCYQNGIVHFFSPDRKVLWLKRQHSIYIPLSSIHPSRPHADARQFSLNDATATVAAVAAVVDVSAAAEQLTQHSLFCKQNNYLFRENNTVTANVLFTMMMIHDIFYIELY